MSTYKGQARKIRDAVMTILSGIQYNGEPAFVDVVSSATDQFDGYPSVAVLPNGQTSINADNVSYEHTIKFASIMFFELSDPDVVSSAQYDHMLDLSDLIHDAVEQADNSNELDAIDPTISNFMMNATNFTWTVATGTVGSMLLAELDIEVSYSKSAL